MNLTEESEPESAVHIVVAHVIHGPPAKPVLDGPYCSDGCAAIGVRILTRSLSERETGSAFVMQDRRRPRGCVVTRDGRMWSVEAYTVDELPIED